MSLGEFLTWLLVYILLFIYFSQIIAVTISYSFTVLCDPDWQTLLVNIYWKYHLSVEGSQKRQYIPHSTFYILYIFQTTGDAPGNIDPHLIFLTWIYCIHQLMAKFCRTQYLSCTSPLQVNLHTEKDHSLFESEESQTL